VLWVWGCEEKANEKGEQIKKKRKQKGQFPRVFFSKRIQENFLREKRSLREFAHCLR